MKLFKNRKIWVKLKYENWKKNHMKNLAWVVLKLITKLKKQIFPKISIWRFGDPNGEFFLKSAFGHDKAMSFDS